MDQETLKWNMFNEKNVNSEIRKALNEGTDHLGGYTVPEIVAGTVMRLAQMEAQVAGIFPTVEMSSDVYHPNRIAGGTTAYIVAEAATITASSLSFARETLTAQKFAARIENITTELLEDSNINIWAEIGPQMTKDIARLIDYEVLEGDGSPGFTGMLNATGVQSISATGANGDVISLEKIIKGKSLLSRNGIRATHLICHPRDVDELELEEDSAGNLILNTLNYGKPNVGENRVGTTKGLFVLESDQISIDNTKGGSTDASNAFIVNSQRAGLLGNNRKMTMAKDYTVSTDTWETAMTVRKAFAVQDPLAVCVLEDLIPS
jgi:HK97 family phage major capsid protein